MVHDKVQGQVEIAVVQGPVPPDADLAAAHESRDGDRVERVG